MDQNFNKIDYVDGTNNWLTPEWLIERINGNFDLDPCAPEVRPWETAKRYYTEKDNGLVQPWEGRVWMNPPYNRHTPHWVHRLKEHGNGIMLVFARTETKMFQKDIFPHAKSIIFLNKRLRFCREDGSPAKDTAPAPSVLVAFGDECSALLYSMSVNRELGKWVQL